MSAPASSRFSVAGAIFHVLNLGVAFFAIFVVWFIIPKFAQIFHDMLPPGQPLPPTTDFVLRFHILWLLSGCGFGLAAVYLAWRYRFQSAPAMLSVSLLFLAAAQVGFITVALFLGLLCDDIIRHAPPAPSSGATR